MKKLFEITSYMDNGDYTTTKVIVNSYKELEPHTKNASEEAGCEGTSYMLLAIGDKEISEMSWLERS